MDHYDQIQPDGRPMWMPDDQGVGRNTYVRGVHHAYHERDGQRQEAFERQWALFKLKCPQLGDDDPEKDAKIGSKEYLIWKKAVRIWEATTRVHPGRIGVHMLASMKGRARNAVLLALSVHGPSASGGRGRNRSPERAEGDSNVCRCS
jgi:hypothetical protein